MKQGILTLMAIAVLLALSTPGYTKAEKVKSVDEVITWAEKLATQEIQLEYLMTKAQEFYVNEQFEEAQQVAEYIVTKVNEDSIEAQELLDEVNTKITPSAEGDPEEEAKL